MGYEVILIGRKLPNSLPINRNYKTIRMRLFFNKKFLFYAEYNLRLFFKLFFIKKDILLSNDLDTLLPNFLISRFFNKTLVYDSHELFTEIPELIDRPRTQKIWLAIEKLILPKIKNCYTVSDSIASYYKNNYSSEFNVIRNLPYRNNNREKGSFSFERENKKVILYQGSVNMGRGVDLMIDAMRYIENAIFVIIGEGDVLDEMKQKVNELKLDNSVKFLGKISPKQLQQLTPLADLGISLEENSGLNYRFALPNKLFDYIQTKIPVIVSDLPEMKKVVEKHNIGTILYNRSSKNLAKQINEMLDKGKQSWQNSLSKAAAELIWEKEQDKLKDLFQNLK
jgi:glycosyltransferase involved in cell wall biosynthesis